MRDRDSVLLQEAYGMIVENLDPQELVGKEVKFHPAQIGGLGNESFMKWSVFLNDKRVGYYNTIHLHTVSAPIDHNKVIKEIINTGKKSPNVYIYGTVIAIDFPENEIPKIISGDNWNSITYNPHKHMEYVYNNSKIPKDKWCSPDWGFGMKGEESIKRRKETSDDYYSKGMFKNLDCVSRGDNNNSIFKCQEMIGKRHLNCGEDYLWVKGVNY